ncbi:hypothetical protein [Paenibacillus sp. GCM10027626]|uniref:hypothetical protein n=1 Tax=Paenibacillus sp. GCM10027626 TaxID=3273411 RepID=UPI00362F0D0A
MAGTISAAADAQYSHWLLELTAEDYLVLLNIADRGMPSVFAAAEAIKQEIAEHHAAVMHDRDRLLLHDDQGATASV